MHIVSRKPWSKIPWKFLSYKQLLNRALLIVWSARSLFYVWIIGLFMEFVYTPPAQQNAVAIVLDTSISMSANDVLPNRYRHAISIATWLIESYQADYITIPFGWIPTVRTPWSHDTAWINQVLSQFNLWSHHVNQAYMWSAPWNAIGLAWDYLKKHPATKKTIVLLWDGNTNTWYTIDAFLPYLVQDKIALLICAMGDTENVLGINYADSNIVNAIDLDRLNYITSQTNWKRWICNDKNESVERLKTTIRQWSITSLQYGIGASIASMRHNVWLHWVTIIAILYILYRTTRGFIRYIFYSEE